MRRSLALPIAAAWIALSVFVAARGVPPRDAAAGLKATFARPPADYSTAPLWIWHDRLTDEMIVQTLRDLAAQHVRQAFVHPRPGLMTPYLSPEWFRLWKVALGEAERLGMKLWIYDENSYPSGFGGGFVPEAMPESRGRGLVFKEGAGAPAWSDDILAVFEKAADTYRDVTAPAKAGSPLPAGKYLVASVALARPSPWYAGKYYVDLLRPGVTEKFLQVTLDAYKREIGGAFGSRVPGVFTDEPELRPAGGLPWTPSLPADFEKRWGYSLTANLPALTGAPAGDWKRTRHDYYQLLLEQFIERWAKPYYEYCERNRLEFTGHYWEHEWPSCQSVPDNMAMAAWQHRPGIDTLMNQYGEGPRSQFGNVRAVKEISSIANQLGRARTLSEGYGASGWDLRFRDMKRIGDWLYVLGVNTLDQHLSYITVRGARKRDHPQSFSYHEPWWSAYHASADYFARLSVAMSAGQQVNEILVIEPTTTAWMYNAAGANPPELDALGESFQHLLLSLERAQVEYDLGSEDVMARHGTVAGGALRVGRRSYRAVVVPPLAENLNTATVGLLERFLDGGGTVLAAGAPPERVDGSVSARGRALAGRGGWKKVGAPDLPAALAGLRDGSFAVARAEGETGILFHHRRHVGDDQLLLLVNTSAEARSTGTVESAAGGVEEWDPASGVIRPYPFEATARGVRLRFDLPEAGSLLLRLTKARQPPVPASVERVERVEPLGPPSVRRAGPNVLVLDYVDVRAGGETLEKTYFYQGSQFAFQKNGLERNPWDSAVQFRDEIVSRALPAAGPVEVTYRFTLAGPVPAGLSVAIERSDLYAVSCNGVRVIPVKGQWWLDRAFGRIDISRAARVGANEIVLRAPRFSLQHEIEPAYLLGDFALDPSASGWTVAGDRPLALGPWNEQGHALYGGGVTYSQHFRVAKASGSYRVELGRWNGSVARVSVNGRPAGLILSAPWALDVTRLLQPGPNRVDVTVVGSLKNTLGPHHEKPEGGAAWPSMFQRAPNPGPPPAAEYSTIGYGLFEPFGLVHAVRTGK